MRQPFCPQSLADSPLDESAGSDGPQRFGLERHLHNFLLDNWDRIDIGKEWVIYSKPGDPDAGYEFVCDVGRIDFLARHRSEKRWLVIELKRARSSDTAVGQALRYMGWVQKHLTEEGDSVEGIIIAAAGDQGLMYAVDAVPNLKFLTYEVDFRLSLTELSETGPKS